MTPAEAGRGEEGGGLAWRGGVGDFERRGGRRCAGIGEGKKILFLSFVNFVSEICVSNLIVWLT